MSMRIFIYSLVLAFMPRPGIMTPLMLLGRRINAARKSANQQEAMHSQLSYYNRSAFISNV